MDTKICENVDDNFAIFFCTSPVNCPAKNDFHKFAGRKIYEMVNEFVSLKKALEKYRVEDFEVKGRRTNWSARFSGHILGLELENVFVGLRLR